jgi:hypothetical protein
LRQTRSSRVFARVKGIALNQSPASPCGASIGPENKPGIGCPNRLTFPLVFCRCVYLTKPLSLLIGGSGARIIISRSVSNNGITAIKVASHLVIKLGRKAKTHLNAISG